MSKLKKLTSIILTVVFMLISIMLPVEQCSAASSIKLSKTKVTLIKGKSITLKITGTKKKVTWKSSKKSVATVSAKGKVTAKKVGTATITATVNNKNYKCKVTVKSSTDTSKKDDTKKEDDEENFNQNVVPKDKNGYWIDATNRVSVTWSGSNSEEKGTVDLFAWNKTSQAIKVNGYVIYTFPFLNYEGEIEDIGYATSNAIRRYNIPSAKTTSAIDCAKWVMKNIDILKNNRNDPGVIMAFFALDYKIASAEIFEELRELGWDRELAKALGQTSDYIQIGMPELEF